VEPDRVGFAARGDGALVMRDDVLYRMAGNDYFQKSAQGFDLAFGEWVESVVQIDEFDADGEIVHVHPAVFHSRLAGVPGALVFSYVRDNGSIAVDRVVRRNLRLRIAEVADNVIEAIENGRVNDDRIDHCPWRPGVEVRRGMMPNIHAIYVYDTSTSLLYEAEDVQRDATPLLT
jgi:hypothetical protein